MGTVLSMSSAQGSRTIKAYANFDKALGILAWVWLFLCGLHSYIVARAPIDLLTPERSNLLNFSWVCCSTTWVVASFEAGRALVLQSSATVVLKAYIKAKEAPNRVGTGHPEPVTVTQVIEGPDGASNEASEILTADEQDLETKRAQKKEFITIHMQGCLGFLVAGLNVAACYAA
jgi:hypothetical protein